MGRFHMRRLLALATPFIHYTHAAQSVPIALDAHFNNQAFGTYPGEASFDILNQSFPGSASDHGANKTYLSASGINYIAPGYRGPEKLDNVVCEGQTIELERPRRAFALAVLHAADVRKKTVLGNVTLGYSDNTTYVSCSDAGANLCADMKLLDRKQRVANI